MVDLPLGAHLDRVVRVFISTLKIHDWNKLPEGGTVWGDCRGDGLGKETVWDAPESPGKHPKTQNCSRPSYRIDLSVTIQTVRSRGL